MKASELERIIAMGIEEAMRWHMGADNRTMVQAIEYGSKKTVAIAIQFGAVTEDGNPAPLLHTSAVPNVPTPGSTVLLGIRHERTSLWTRMFGPRPIAPVDKPRPEKAKTVASASPPVQVKARASLGISSDDWDPLYAAMREKYGFHFGPDHTSHLKHKLKFRGHRRAPEGLVEYKGFPRFGVPLAISQIRKLVDMGELPAPDYKTRGTVGWRPEVIEAFAAKILELATRP